MTIENPVMTRVVIPRSASVAKLRKECDYHFRRNFKQRIWEEFKQNPQRIFFNLVAEEVNGVLGLKDKILLAFKQARLEVHHILPLSLGGTNHPNNFALVDTKLHRMIHQKIGSYDQQMPGLSAVVGIPVYPGKIWIDGLRPARKNRTQPVVHASPQQLQLGVGLRP